MHWRIAAVVLIVSASTHLSAQTQTTAPPFALVQPEAASGPPTVITLRDAIERARQVNAEFQAVSADAQAAREDRVQARAGLFPSVSHTTQYLGTQGDTPLATGRFVSNDGVKLYRSWMVVHQDLSAGTLTLTPLRRAQAAEALASAQLEIARRGLTVTVTRAYYTLVSTERRYAASQEASAAAERFRAAAEAQQRLGQVARADVVKAQIQSQQQQQAYRESLVQMDAARLQLAVLLSPTLEQNFTVVDDLTSAPALPAFAEARAMAEQGNPELKAATEALHVAQQDVRGARQAFLPSVAIDADYGIEANQFALHSVAVAAPELGVLPNLGYFVTVNLSVPVWDWGGMRSRLRQGHVRATQAEVQLSQTQRQLVANLYAYYNEAIAARAAVDSTHDVADLAAESLRLTNLRYEAGESTALEAVDAQNTLVQARDDYDAALTRYRVALATLQTLTGAF